MCLDHVYDNIKPFVSIKRYTWIKQMRRKILLGCAVSEKNSIGSKANKRERCGETMRGRTKGKEKM